MFSRKAKAPKPAVFRGEINTTELPALEEIRLASLQLGEFDLLESIKLDVKNERVKTTLRWRDADIEVSGATLGQALDQLRSVIRRRANEPEIQRFLKPMLSGGQIRAFKPSDG